jgi:hypothetical protein
MLRRNHQNAVPFIATGPVIIFFRWCIDISSPAVRWDT